ncbi:unnamed protein product, partial [Iphiclides podalirius]
MSKSFVALKISACDEAHAQCGRAAVCAEWEHGMRRGSRWTPRRHVTAAFVSDPRTRPNCTRPRVLIASESQHSP